MTPQGIAALERQKTVRSWIAKNPGKTKDEIAAGVGFAGGIPALQLRRLVRAVGNGHNAPQTYFVVELKAIAPPEEHIKIQMRSWGGNSASEY